MGLAECQTDGHMMGVASEPHIDALNLPKLNKSRVEIKIYAHGNRFGQSTIRQHTGNVDEQVRPARDIDEPRVRDPNRLVRSVQQEGRVSLEAKSLYDVVEIAGVRGLGQRSSGRAQTGRLHRLHEKDLVAEPL